MEKQKALLAVAQADAKQKRSELVGEPDIYIYIYIHIYVYIPIYIYIHI